MSARCCIDKRRARSQSPGAGGSPAAFAPASEARAGRGVSLAPLVDRARFAEGVWTHREHLAHREMNERRLARPHASLSTSSLATSTADPPRWLTRAAGLRHPRREQARSPELPTSGHQPRGRSTFSRCRTPLSTPRHTAASGDRQKVQKTKRGPPERGPHLLRVRTTFGRVPRPTNRRSLCFSSSTRLTCSGQHAGEPIRGGPLCDNG